MKKIFIYNVLIACLLMLITSCTSGDKQTLYNTFGVVKESTGNSGKLYIRSDNGKIIIPNSALVSLNDKRVWLSFFTDDDVEKSDTLKVAIYDLLKITSAALKTGNSDTLASLPNDPIVTMDKIWTAQGYLTFAMKLYAYSPTTLEKHKYILYSDLFSHSDTLKLDLRYDNDNDRANVLYNKLLTIKVEDLLPTTTANKPISVLAIKYNTGNGVKTQYVDIQEEK